METFSAELELQLAPRQFNSFLDAANEAAISRFYGGIHYILAIKKWSGLMLGIELF